MKFLSLSLLITGNGGEGGSDTRDFERCKVLVNEKGRRRGRSGGANSAEIGRELI